MLIHLMMLLQQEIMMPKEFDFVGQNFASDERIKVVRKLIMAVTRPQRKDS